ncbi:MAG: shikimate kinase [Thermodesulfovibrio sp.]|nr:shikimate kinase [Thermodesulfovibrio sp.]
MDNNSNIVLIGMPGAGKSTVGIILAKMTSRDFIDTDILIQLSTGRSLQEIVDTEGPLALRRIEEEVILTLCGRHHVIATGGSAAYSAAAMDHLRLNGTVVFLDLDLYTLLSRIHNIHSRGIAKQPEQSMEELFEERLVLYRKYADLTIACAGLSQEEVCMQIIAGLSKKTAGPG